MEDSRKKINILNKNDLEISYFIGSGKGGQNKQKTSSGVQIIHKESKAIGRSSETRSQDQNKRTAFERMLETPKFKVWLSKKLFEIREKQTIEEEIEKTLTVDKLKFEIKQNGKWTEVKNEYFDSELAKTEN